jgi:hypothetical protein
MFQYSLEDYIFQNFLRDLDNKSPNIFGDSIWKVLGKGFRDEQADEIEGVMKAYYSAFNRQNFDDLGLLFLPDENTELLLPGYSKMVSL